MDSTTTKEGQLWPYLTTIIFHNYIFLENIQWFIYQPELHIMLWVELHEQIMTDRVNNYYFNGF